jgi:hypothetical protein
MGRRKQGVYSTVPLYEEEIELRICKSVLLPDGGLKVFPAINPHYPYHFYFDRRTGCFMAHDKDGRTFRVIYGELFNQLFEQAQQKAGIKPGKIPRGFIREVSGKDYPPPMFK